MPNHGSQHALVPKTSLATNIFQCRRQARQPIAPPSLRAQGSSFAHSLTFARPTTFVSLPLHAPFAHLPLSTFCYLHSLTFHSSFSADHPPLLIVGPCMFIVAISIFTWCFWLRFLSRQGVLDCALLPDTMLLVAFSFLTWCSWLHSPSYAFNLFCVLHALSFVWSWLCSLHSRSTVVHFGAAIVLLSTCFTTGPLPFHSWLAAPPPRG